jgi:signal transduction histidine kinase
MGRTMLNSRSSLVVLVTGFGILVVLIAILGIGALRRTDAIYRDMQAAQDSWSQTETFRRGVVLDMYLADILVRDYLLDPSPRSAPHHREQLLPIRDSLQKRVDQLSGPLLETHSPDLLKIQEEVEAYWASLDPIFEWTPQEKAERSWAFLARRVLPRREAIVELAREVAKINAENVSRERQRLQASQQVLHDFLLEMMGVSLGLGIVVALLTTYRVVSQRREIEETKDNLRRLSQSLVQAQEVERRRLSRELHDEVGQTMTALGIQLGNLESSRSADETFRTRMEVAKQLNAEAMKALRDLAMGLRPSMLDDLGLQAALQWQGREFSRHTGVPANVQVDGSLDELSDEQSTCIYRVVQEALTNCARHANAKEVSVAVRAQGDSVEVMIEDDGIGFRPASRRRGLGLLGIRERVEAIRGSVSVFSEPGKGTRVEVEIPMGVAA